MRVQRSGCIRFIKELPSGDLLAGIDMDTAGAVVARMNANGDFLWAKSYIRPEGVVHDALIESDDSFIIIGFTDSLATTQPFGGALPPASFQPKLYMMKLDGTGEVQWCRGWKSQTNYWYMLQQGRIKRTLDGNYVVLANLGSQQTHTAHRPFLMKTDQNGTALWTRTVGRPNYYYITQDLLPYSDGGFLISGIMYGDMPNSTSGLMYIYKADSLGHFPCWEQAHAFDSYELFPQDSSFTLTAIAVPVIQAPVFVQDSILDPSIFTTWDGCTFGTGVPPTMSRNRSMSIRPNPSPGRFTLEVPDPLMAESYYSVYDALGKLLYQRPLPAGATVEEVDLSRFGRGNYVVRLTDPEGVRWERVALE